MMKKRRILSAIFGIAQVIIGLLSGAIAVLFGLNIIEVQTVLTAPTELLMLYLLILGLFSIFSTISGLFLIREGQK